MLTPIKDYPALVHQHKQHKTLVIADLHLGWEINLIQRGIHVPSQMLKIRQKLIELINETKPDTLIILGDVKNTIAKTELGEWRDIPEFLETIRTKINDIQIIRGNHDGNLEPLLPPSIKLHPSTGITLNMTGFFHGHTWPARKLLQCKTLVMGHLHPTVLFRDSLGFRITTPVWIKAQCDQEKLKNSLLKSKQYRTTKTLTAGKRKSFDIEPKVSQLLIMPCFNDFLGGRPVNKKRERRRYIGPVLRTDAIDVDKADIYLLDGTFLGTISQLKALS
ncbi:MAG: metallophosphoesterase [Candidatus Bathyarchaeota archaeon]|nr:MAG: metallophosphoesterase [Candidatus Bathyarchaeota archaeon]